MNRSGHMNRPLAVARTHFVDRYSMLAMPMVVLGSGFALSLASWAFLPSGQRVSGALVSIYCYVFAAAILAVARGFGFNLGMARHGGPSASARESPVWRCPCSWGR